MTYFITPKKIQKPMIKKNITKRKTLTMDLSKFFAIVKPVFGLATMKVINKPFRRTLKTLKIESTSTWNYGKTINLTRTIY